MHEAAHAFAADQLGDSTARQLGRLSLNPAVHVDPIGTLVFPLIAFVTGVPLIGWAKPVPVNMRFLKHPEARFRADRRGRAGKQSGHGGDRRGRAVDRPRCGGPGDIAAGAVTGPLVQLFFIFTVVNVLLAVFNMIPVPPLDGGNVLIGLLPAGPASMVEQLRPYGILILYALMLTGVLSTILGPGGAGISVSRLVGRSSRVAKQRVLSGMRPTGKLHIGHFVGALQNWVTLQQKYDSFHCVVDWHALTTHYADTSEIVANTFDNVADWIGAGLDPEKSTFFIQSLVPEHAELYLLFQMVTPIPWLERVPTYKEQIEQMTDRDLSSIGFLGYPLLQAADIAVYDAHWVPVGDDQVPHLELSREVDSTVQ